MKLGTSEEMRRIEGRIAADGLALPVLMELAGRVVAEGVVALRSFDFAQDRQAQGGRGGVLVLVGPANNGGDGLVAARHLHNAGVPVEVACFPLRDDADANARLVQRLGITCWDGSDLARLERVLERVDTVLDALFGIGRLRPIEGAMQAALGVVARSRAARPELGVIALDLPSGLDADTGRVDPTTAAAEVTLTLGFPKVGLYAFPGADYAGEVRVLDIGIPTSYAEDVPTDLLTPEVAGRLLPERPRQSNKGTFGRALVVGGSPSYVGAPVLAAQGAARAGAGLVTLGVARSLQPLVAAQVSECTFLSLPEAEPGVLGSEAVGSLLKAVEGYGALLIGCGLGQDPATATFVRAQLERWLDGLPVVVDADGLNLLAEEPRWAERWSGDGVVTPHPGEMARLMRNSVADVQADRLGMAREAAARWRKTVVLKGAFTVVAAPSGEARVSPVATAALATAGTGDVLAGVIVGLLAQGLGPFEAASLGVWLHGRAGEMVATEVGEAGVVAGDLLPLLPRAMRELRQG